MVHPNASQYIFFFLVAYSIVTTIIKAIGEWVEERYAKTLDSFRNSLIDLASKLVRSKLDRFKIASQQLSKGENIFDKITQPSDQINIILAEFSKLIQDKFELLEEQVCITIMRIEKTNNTEKASFEFTTQRDWVHTDAQQILNEQSTAKECLDTGEHLFIPDKNKAHKKKSYYVSNRDQRNGNNKGIIYCYPSFNLISNDTSTQHIISVVTYGKNVFYSGDNEKINGIKLIFKEICRRIDLELTLKSIKDWQS